MRDIEVPVLIVGAGGAGLSSSMLLSDLGIETLTISSARSTSVLPKAHVLHQRTMEMFRRLGVADDIYEQSTPAENMTATAWYAGFVGPDADTGRQIAKMESWGAGYTDPAWVSASPCRQANLPQIRLEPILLRHAERKAPGSILFNHELLDFDQDENGVTAHVLDRDSGDTCTVRAKYLLGCDGGRTVGALLGIELEGMRNILYNVSVHMSADLSKWARDPDVLIRWMWPPHTGLLTLLVPMGPTKWGPDSEEWVFHLNYSTDDKRVFDDEQMIRDMLEVLGTPDLDPKIHLITRWSFEALLAPRFRAGKAFLLGDSAHRHGPTGGLGLNTAVQDAQNVCWKIAAVLSGQASESLLDTYEQERRPVAARNVQRSTENAMHHMAIGETLGVGPDSSAEHNWKQMRRVWSDAPEDAEYRRTVRASLAAQSQEFSEHNVEYGYAYESDAVVADGTPVPANADDVRIYEPGTRPGAPLPHAFLEDDRGERVALVDVAAPQEFLLIAGEDGQDWCDAASQVAADLGVPVRAIRVGHDEGVYLDPRLAWIRRREISRTGAVLVRPDHVVCWRAMSGLDDPAAVLAAALGHVLGTRKGSADQQVRAMAGHTAGTA